MNKGVDRRKKKQTKITPTNKKTNKNPPAPYHLYGLWESKFKNFWEHHLGLQLIAQESKVSLAWGLFPAPHFPPQHFPCAKRWGFVTLCCLYTPYPQLAQHLVARINSIKFIKQLELGEQCQKNLSESPLSFLNKFIPAGFMLLVHRLPTWIPAWEVRGRKGFGRVNVKWELEAVCKSWA